MKDQFSRRARSVDEPIADRSKADTSIAHLPNGLDQVVHGMIKSVEPQDYERISHLRLGKARINTATPQTNAYSRQVPL